MDTNYTPKVGDRVQRPSWGLDQWFDVTAVGRGYFLGVSCNYYESPQSLTGEWLKMDTPTPLPERWINVYPTRAGSGYSVRYLADRIAVLHIWTDADCVDHAEIARVTP